MTKKEKTIMNNPFNFVETDATSGVKMIDFTPELIQKSNAKATELMRVVAADESLHELANLALDRAETADVTALIAAVYSAEVIAEDAAFLEGAEEDVLSRLLESRRSDRSKAKSKGPRTSAAVCQTFISAMYAELLVRKAWNKPIQAAAIELDYDGLKEDQAALNRKIRSLQSKQSRLRKTAEFVEADARELEDVMDEIDRLKSLRIGVPKVSAKVAIRSADAETLRAALGKLKADDLTEEEQSKLEELMAKLG